MLNIDLNSPEYINLFIEEVTEIVDRLENSLINYEEKSSAEINRSIKRDFHTLKGDFSTYGLLEISDFFHKIETDWLSVEEMSVDDREFLISSVLGKISEIREILRRLPKEGFAFLNTNELVRDIDVKVPEKNKVEENPISKIVDNSEEAEEQKKNIDTEETGDKRYEIIIDFKGEKREDFDIDELKNILEIYGKIIEFSFITDNVPALADLDPQKLYIKIKIILETEDVDILKSTLTALVDNGMYSIKGMNWTEDVKFETQLEKLQAEEISVLKESKDLEKVIPEIQKKIDKELSKITRFTQPADNIDTKKKEVTSIRVNTKKLDNLVNIIGELIVAHSSLKVFKDSVSEKDFENFEKVITDLDSITKSMQEDILSIRMLPIGNTFIQLKRMIRDISKKLDKKIKFEIKGGETEIDKTIIEKIIDPLRHMIRNSIDHGIETEENRVLSGKNPEGLISINAYHREGEVIIEIFDDGKGLDPDKIMGKAVDKGIISKEDKLTFDEKLMLIFEPGFTTKENVTELSGRGVGMDVVKNNLEEIRGKIEVESKKGEYTLFKLRLPLTLAIIDGMLVSVGENIYVLPILSILESFQPDDSNLKSVQGKDEILEIRGEYIPLIKLFKVFNVPNAIKDPRDATIFIVETYRGKLGLMVDEVIDHQQIVIKKLSINNKEANKFSGATILGNGEVALILDIKNIFDSLYKKTGIGGDTIESVS